MENVTDRIFDTNVTTFCVNCDKEYVLNVNSEDLEKWETTNIFVQDAFSYLTPAERELLISGICGTCFDKMFSSGF